MYKNKLTKIMHDSLVKREGVNSFWSTICRQSGVQQVKRALTVNPYKHFLNSFVLLHVSRSCT